MKLPIVALILTTSANPALQEILPLSGYEVHQSWKIPDVNPFRVWNIPDVNPIIKAHAHRFKDSLLPSIISLVCLV